MKPEEIQVIDLGEATVLLTLNFTLLRLETATGGKHKIFIFEKIHPNEKETIEVEDMIDVYRRRKLSVDALTFYRCGKEIKNRIHEHNEMMSR